METKKRNKLSLKELESYLQGLDGFENPKIELEQYATPPHIAALMLNTIDLTYGELEGRFVADLGCGTGSLSVGSLLCGANLVYGFDIDREALQQGMNNIYEIFSDEDDNCESDAVTRSYQGCERFNFVQIDLSTPDCEGPWKFMSKKFDTVIMNPPFGTKQNQGLDMLFLKRGIDLSADVIYSLHKTSTREYILNKCQQLQVKAKPVAQIKYNLENTYKFHKKKSVDIDVDLWRIKCSDSREVLSYGI